MAGKSIKKQTPMRLFITEVLRPVTGEANEEDCINTLLRVSKYAMNGPYISNCINGYKNWTGQAKKAFSSKEVFNLLISLLEGKNYQQLLNKTLSQCETLTSEPTDALAPMVYSDIFSLSSFFCQQNSPMLQKKLTATAVQAYLCYLTGANDSEKYWDEEVDSFFYNRKSTSIKSQGRTQGGENCSPDIVQILENNSREEFSRLQGLLKYKVEPKLVSAVNCDITRHNHILLVGDGGAGKTSFLLDYWGKLLSNDSAETQSLPIYVPLNRFEGNDEFFIRNYIKAHYFSSQNDLEFDDWVKNAKDCGIILLLDAINEAKNSRELGSEIEGLCALGCKIILTSRHEMEGWVSLENFKRVHLLPLSETIVDEQLEEHKLEVSERLRPLLTKPMYLALLLKIGEGAKDVESPGELLLAHHKWIQQTFGVDKHGLVYHEIGEIAFDTVLPQIASAIDTLKFNGKDVKAVIDNYLSDEGWDCREVLNLFVDAGILTKERQTYFFSHEHYLDFYRAYGIYLEMQEDNVPQILRSRIITSIIAEFLGDLCGEYRFEAKLSCDNDMSPVEVWLQDHMRHDDIGSDYTDECRQMTTRNLIEVMKIARRNHITACYDGLDLSLTHLYDCALPNSSFDNAIVPESTIISQGHTSRLRHLTYLQESNILVTAGDDNQVLFWNVKTSTVKRRVKTSSRVAGLDVSPDGKHVLILLEISRPAIILLPTTDDSKEIVINAPDKAVKYSFAKFSADSNRIICASENGLIHILDAETGGLVCPGIQLEQGIYDAPFEYSISSNRQFLVNGTTGGDIEVRRISNLEKPITTLAFDSEEDSHVHNIAFTQNGKYCVVKNYNHLIAWNMKSKKGTPENKAEVALGNFMFQFVPTENGVCFFDHGSNHLHIWDISNNRPIGKEFPCHLCCMALSTDSKLLVLADEKGKIYFVNPTNFETVHTMWVGYTPRKSHYLHNRHHLGSEDVLFRRTWAGYFELYNRKKSQFIRIPIQPDPLLDTTTVPFWENWYCVDDYLCYVDGGVCSIWSMSYGNHVQDVELKGYRIDAVIPQKDLIVGCNYLDSDYPICLWTLSTGKPLASLDTHGTWVCGIPINAEPIKIQSGNFWSQMSKFANIYGLKKEYFTHATFSDLGIMVGGTDEGAIRIWDLSSQQLIHEENIAAAQITKLTPLKKSTLVVIQAENHSVIIYDVAARCSKGCWMDNANILRNVRFLKFITHDNRNCHEELVEVDLMGATVYRLNLESGTLVSYIEDKHDENIAVSQNGEWMAVNKFLQPPLPYKLILYSVQNDEMVSIPLTEHKLWPNCAFSPSCDGRYLLISNEAGAVYLLDSTTGEQSYKWVVCDAKDICGCNFTNAILERNVVKQLIQMNGGNV